MLLLTGILKHSVALLQDCYGQLFFNSYSYPMSISNLAMENLINFLHLQYIAFLLQIHV